MSYRATDRQDFCSSFQSMQFFMASHIPLFLRGLLVICLFLPPAETLANPSEGMAAPALSVSTPRFLSYENLFDRKIAPSAIEASLMDSDRRLNRQFQVPNDLKESVRFWLRIYTEFTTQHVVIYDSKHPEIIYEVLDFRGLSKLAKGRMHYEITVKQQVNATVKRYRKALNYLAKNASADSILGQFKQEITNIRSALAQSKHKHGLSELAHNLRSQTGQRDNIVKGLMSAEIFFPKMEKIFEKTGTPKELTRLSLVESSFNLEAKSRVGAAGVWQFMRNPGGKFLLIEPHGHIDERLSPLKATWAAALLLKENYQRFRNWPLTITAYNHGLRGLKRVKSSESEDFGKIAHLFKHCKTRSPLGWAARNYYSEFLAVLHAETYRKLFYGEPPSTHLWMIQYTKIAKPISIDAFTSTTGISPIDFRILNPDVQTHTQTLPAGFLVATRSQNENFDALFARKRSKTTQTSLGITYKIKSS